MEAEPWEPGKTICMWSLRQKSKEKSTVWEAVQSLTKSVYEINRLTKRRAGDP